MNWRDWPDGAEYADDTEHIPGANECPVCHTSLRPVETYYTSSCENVTYYMAVCPHCRTKYNRVAETVIISPDAEAITELEERVRILEETLSRLISFIRQSQVQPRQIPSQQPEEAQDDAEEFTRKYRYLL